MKALKVICQIVGVLCILVAVLMFGIGETGVAVALLVGSVLLLVGAAKLSEPVPPPQRQGWQPPQQPNTVPAWEPKAMRQRRQAAERKQQAAAEGVACCPRCGSTSLSLNKKGFGGGKATAGMFITGGLGGAVAGTYGMNKMKITCMNCGYTYKPGKKTRI